MLALVRNLSLTLALINNEEKKDYGCFLVIHSLRKEPAVMNRHSAVEDNAAWLADGGIDLISTKKAPFGRWQMSGVKKNNYYGNNSFAGGKFYPKKILVLSCFSFHYIIETIALLGVSYISRNFLF